jgi:hypothetical protein
MISLTLVLLLGLANLVAMQYAHGAIRTAVDEGARYGAFVGNTVIECRERADAVLRGEAGLLRGAMGETIQVRCEVGGDVMRAVASGTFEWWFGGLPQVDVRVVGEALIEAPP